VHDFRERYRSRKDMAYASVVAESLKASPSWWNHVAIFTRHSSVIPWTWTVFR